MRFLHILTLLSCCILTGEETPTPTPTPATFARFYETSRGEMIMNPQTHNEEIRGFLFQENKFILSQLPDRYDCLFEVGCGPSERALDVVKLGCRYFGVDINENYVVKSNLSFADKGIKSQAESSCISIQNINTANFPVPKSQKTLILFPFNLMGNLDDFHLILMTMIDMAHDFCFSTYKHNELVKKSRFDYYTACGCEQLRYSYTPIGDLFDSKDGLHSASFKIGYLVELINSLLDEKQKTGTIIIKDLSNKAFMVYVKDIRNLDPA